MKRILTFIAATLMVGTMAAQHEQLHIFRNDGKFNTHKGAEISSITFNGKPGQYESMTVTTENGKTNQYSMSVVDSCVMRPTGLPEFHVTLQDYPTWTELQGSKDDVHPATLYMKGNGMYEDIPEQTVEFRGRGNSTWGMKKKPYRFKMDKKTAVCGMPKAKTHVLLANNIDCTLMRNVIAFWIANWFEMPYSNHTVPVKVYFNGIDKGQYILTEKIGIGSESVDIDETEGMLFELDSNYDEPYKFKYDFYYNGRYRTIPVMVKDPDVDELIEEGDLTGYTSGAQYVKVWETEFKAMCDAVTQRGSNESIADVLDVESAAKYILLNAIANNHELCHPKSFYIHKAKLGSAETFHLGPGWDFDWAFTFNGDEGAPWDEVLLTKDGDYAGASFLRLIASKKEVRDAIQAKLNDFYENGYPELLKFMDEYAALIEPTAKENGAIWPSHVHASWCIVTSSYEFCNNYEILKTWIDNRLEYMMNHQNFGVY